METTMAKAKAKGKSPNFLFIGEDGKIAITSATGELTVASSEVLLRGDVLELIKTRQAAGKALTKALAEANYRCASDSEMLVIDPSNALGALVKKKRGKKR